MLWILIIFVEKLEKKGKLKDIFLYDINSETDNDMSDTFVKIQVYIRYFQ